ncbi:hypothetical protein [Streptomyces sp. NPDC101132]|uniref:hypothetical protein n=1 Tax=Streptomyces sp. NPDC101132 TaxID=3366110 RepID=UPI0038235CE6
MAALISLGAALWYLSYAVIRFETAPWHAVNAALFGLAGAALLAAGARLARGHAAARATAHRVALLVLVVVAGFLGVWIIQIAMTGDWDRVQLAVRQGLVTDLISTGLPALAVVVTTRRRPSRRASSPCAESSSAGASAHERR